MTRTEALALGRPLGGQAVKTKLPPETCPRCGAPMQGRTWHSYLGHLGLHGLADNFFGGDLKAAHKRLTANGLARQDPAPWNGAWPKYRPIKESTGEVSPPRGAESTHRCEAR